MLFVYGLMGCEYGYWEDIRGEDQKHAPKRARVRISPLAGVQHSGEDAIEPLSVEIGGIATWA